MQWIVIALIVLHVVTGVFWAGSSFVLARMGGLLVEKLAFPQFGAGVATLCLGMATWFLALRGLPPTPGFHVLGIGAACAVLALIVQASALPAVKTLKGAQGDSSPQQRRVLISQRVAAGLLLLAVLAMASWSHV
ncbi:hypothetical protein [Pinirhizobacter soli]|uniref:hypothetical protein n=1 Tax=Pinirhizobacter soli TaxID=2786953 RepID=UPI00202A4FBB|nr:hypothetical protein [Pinirhizobacter soli]